MIGWLSMTNTSLVVHVNEDEGLLNYEKISILFFYQAMTKSLRT